jgi:hypothetical protein
MNRSPPNSKSELYSNNSNPKCTCGLSYTPRLNQTYSILFPSFDSRSWNSGSNVDTCTLCRCGNAPIANGKATKLTPRINAKLTGSTILGRLFNQFVCCNLYNKSGGIAITGVAFNARDAAVSETANNPAFLELPRIVPSSSLTCIPWYISSTRMRKTLTTPAETTAAKGTRRVRIVRVTGLRLRRRGTRELRPKAMEQETVVAMR